MNVTSTLHNTYANGYKEEYSVIIVETHLLGKRARLNVVSYINQVEIICTQHTKKKK